MKTTSRMTSADRREAIIRAARKVFVEKGFYGTTTRELAKAAGVSEALMFRHFPNKEALYSAIQMSCFKHEGTKIREQLESLEPSTSTLAFMVRDLVSRALKGPPDDDRAQFFRLVVRSLMDEGEFTRQAIQSGPAKFVKKLEECIRAAARAGDMLERPTHAAAAGWLVHHLITGIMIHSLPAESIIDCGLSSDELTKQVVWFCLRGIGLKDEAIKRYYASKSVRT